MKISQFDYKLPKEKIAQAPAIPRDSSKLLILDRNTGHITHKIFSDLTHILTANDVLVFNQTRVMPARLFGRKTTGGKVEILLLKEAWDTWQCIGKNIPDINKKIIFNKNVFATVKSKNERLAKIEFNISRVKLNKFLEGHGNMPLPPYIIDFKTGLDLKSVYNTVYAKNTGSAAAPTAGLHFTKTLLARLKTRGVGFAFIDLKVGLGTFEPVTADSLNEHKIHSEEFELTSNVAQCLNGEKRKGKRIIAVGTTTVRVLETCANSDGYLKPKHGSTNIFIYPPYRFRFADALITNFHLPKSTLLALVSAFVSKPNTKHDFEDFNTSTVGKAYTEAIKKSYRFFSFGDAMLIS